jgi:hypothetical protein
MKLARVLLGIGLSVVLADTAFAKSRSFSFGAARFAYGAVRGSFNNHNHNYGQNRLGSVRWGTSTYSRFSGSSTGSSYYRSYNSYQPSRSYSGGHSSPSPSARNTYTAPQNYGSPSTGRRANYLSGYRSSGGSGGRYLSRY